MKNLILLLLIILIFSSCQNYIMSEHCLRNIQHDTLIIYENQNFILKFNKAKSIHFIHYNDPNLYRDTSFMKLIYHDSTSKYLYIYEDSLLRSDKSKRLKDKLNRYIYELLIGKEAEVFYKKTNKKLNCIVSKVEKDGRLRKDFLLFDDQIIAEGNYFLLHDYNMRHIFE